MPEILAGAVRELTEHVDALRKEVAEEREQRRREFVAEREQRRRSIRRRTLVVIAIVLAFALGLGLAVKTNRADIGRNNRRWCALLSTLVDPTAPPPSTPRQRVIAERLAAQYKDFGCP